MRHDRQLALLARYGEFRNGKLPDHAERSMRNSASAYVDPERFAREIRVLFRERPIPVGLSCECREPGSYLATRLGDVPVVVVRQPDGALRGFLNACRHRGAPILSGRGEGLRSIACPYHAWNYRLDGTLRARPLEWGFDDVDKGQCSLFPIAVAEKYGLVFAQAGTSSPISIDDLLEGMEGEIAEYELDGYTHFETRTREWDFNWKLVIDTFAEAYHIPALHRRSIAPDYDFRNSIWDPFGYGQRTVNFRTSIEEELAARPEHERTLLPHTTIEYFLVPNAVLTHQLDHVELWRAMPISVDRKVYLQRYARSTVEHYQFDRVEFAAIEGYEYYAKLADNIAKHGLEKFNSFLADLQVWGTPGEVVEKLLKAVEYLDVGALLTTLCYGGMPPEVARSNFDLFVSKVLPVVKAHDVGGDIGVRYGAGPDSSRVLAANA